MSSPGAGLVYIFKLSHFYEKVALGLLCGRSGLLRLTVILGILMGSDTVPILAGKG